jgi:hypothetical protein
VPSAACTTSNAQNASCNSTVIIIIIMLIIINHQQLMQLIAGVAVGVGHAALLSQLAVAFAISVAPKLHGARQVRCSAPVRPFEELRSRTGVVTSTSLRNQHQQHSQLRHRASAHPASATQFSRYAARIAAALVAQSQQQQPALSHFSGSVHTVAGLDSSSAVRHRRHQHQQSGSSAPSGLGHATASRARGALIHRLQAQRPSQVSRRISLTICSSSSAGSS